MRFSRTLAAIATAATASLAIATAAPGVSFAANNLDSGVTAALSSVTSGLVQQAVPSATDADSAAQTATVDVPFDPVQGVTLKQGGATTVVGLPDAQHLSRGVRQTSGVVVYHNSNGSDAVVVPTSSGAQFLTVIENAAAPEDYTYPLTLSAGQTVQVTDGGYALVLDSTGKPVSSIAVPWAQGGGSTVATSFTTNGTALVQHIAHKASGTSYPVVADPYITWQAINFTLWYNEQEVKNMRGAGFWAIVGGIVATGCSRLPNWPLEAACAGIVTGASWWIGQTFSDAANSNQCVWISVSYGGDLDGWGKYRC